MSSCIPTGGLCKVVMFFVSFLSDRLIHFLRGFWWGFFVVLKQSRALRVPALIWGLCNIFYLFVRALVQKAQTTLLYACCNILLKTPNAQAYILNNPSSVTVSLSLLLAKQCF